MFFIVWRFKHIAFDERRLSKRRPAGETRRSMKVCLEALREPHSRARQLGLTQSEHSLFPRHENDKQLDPTRPKTSWRTAWRSLRKAAGLPHLWFHDGRHTALTRLAENGLPDGVFRAL